MPWIWKSSSWRCARVWEMETEKRYLQTAALRKISWQTNNYVLLFHFVKFFICYKLCISMLSNPCERTLQHLFYFVKFPYFIYFVSFGCFHLFSSSHLFIYFHVFQIIFCIPFKLLWVHTTANLYLFYFIFLMYLV